MYFQTFQTPDQASSAVVALIIARIKAFAPTQHRKFVLGLPTGSTPLLVYRELAERCRAMEISFEHVTTVNLDEYVGLTSLDEQGYHHFMEENFFSKVDIPPIQTHLLPGIPVPPHTSHADSCAAYEALITRLGGIHLLFLGIGQNGHVGFNEPGSSFKSRTRVVDLDEGTRRANARFFTDMAHVPTQALSMGLGTILDAAEIVVLATGSSKAGAIKRALEGGVDHLCPASALQLHESVSIIADSQAASELRVDTAAYLSAQAPPKQDDQDDQRTAPIATGDEGGMLITPISPLSPSGSKLPLPLPEPQATLGPHGPTALARGEMEVDDSMDEEDIGPGL